MQNQNNQICAPSADLKQTLADIAASVAAGNKALDRLLDAENRLLAHLKNETHRGGALEELNASVNSIAKSISFIQLINKYALEEAEKTLRKFADEFDELEE